MYAQLKSYNTGVTQSCFIVTKYHNECIQHQTDFQPYFLLLCLSVVQFISWPRIIAIIVASISLLLLIAMEAATTTNPRYLHVISNNNNYYYLFIMLLTVNFEETFNVEISLFFYYNI